VGTGRGGTKLHASVAGSCVTAFLATAAPWEPYFTDNLRTFKQVTVEHLFAGQPATNNTMTIARQQVTLKTIEQSMAFSTRSMPRGYKWKSFEQEMILSLIWVYLSSLQFSL
jgi:hypothetical protein